MATTLEHSTLCFDPTRPFGTLDDGVECRISNKTISFHDAQKRSKQYGYAHVAQCSPLCGDKKRQHVVCFRVTGLVQEYGLNAVEFTLDPEDRRVEPGSSRRDHVWSEDSQHFAPYPTCFITFLYDTAKSTLTLYAEGDQDSSGAKRKRTDDAPEWYQGRSAFTPYTKVASGLWMSKVHDLVPPVDGAPMRFGVRMSSMLDNVVTIVDPLKTRAWQMLRDELTVGVVYK